MMFKTVIGRISYANEFDALMEKTIGDISKDGYYIEDIIVSTSDRMIVAVIKYGKKEKKSGSRKAASAQA